MAVYTTRRFGDVSVADADVYSFPSGLPGFPGLSRFVILPHPGGGPFQWLQSLEKPDVAFVVCDPLMFEPEYRAEVKKEDLEPIGLANIEEGFVLVILTVPADPQKMTANLLGPLVFNPGAMKARQIVLGKRKPTDARAPVFKEAR